MPQGDTQKWKTAFQHYNQWDTESARRVQEKEAKVIIQWLKDLKRPKYEILEIGCGNGYVGQLIIEGLVKQNIPVSYTFADLLPECLEVAKKNTADLQQKADLSFIILDVYEAEKILGEKSQNIIISTGFASAATYRDAVPIVSKILKKDGVLIADFVNHLSPVLFLSKFPRSVFELVKILKKNTDGKSYHFGIYGVRDFFARYELKLLGRETIAPRQNPLLCRFRKTQ